MEQWSLEIEHSPNKKEWNDLATVLAKDVSLRNYFHLCIEYMPENDIPHSIFVMSEYVDKTSIDAQEAFNKLSSIYLMLKGVLVLYFNNTNNYHISMKIKNYLYKGHEPSDGMKPSAIHKMQVREPLYLFPFEDIEKFKLIDENNILSLIKLAMNNSELFKLLMQFGFENSWVRLFTILDSIRYIVNTEFIDVFSRKNSKKSGFQEWVNKFLNIDCKKVELFTRSANSYGLLFLYSRHGGEPRIGGDLSPMEHLEAINLIKTMMLKLVDNLLIKNSYIFCTTYIYSHYHDERRSQLKELLNLADEVERENLEHPACPKGLIEQTELIMKALESHMQREETCIFPMIKRGEYAAARGSLKIMEQELDNAEDIVAKVLKITHQLQLPKDASEKWKGLYKKFGIFIGDLDLYIYLANEVLFSHIAVASCQRIISPKNGRNC